MPARCRPETPQELRLTRGAARRQAGAADPGSAHLGHRPLQLPLRLLHAEGGLRPRLRVPRPRRAPDLRGDRAARARRSPAWASRRYGSPAASRCCAATWRRWSAMLAAIAGRRPDADDERRRCWPRKAQALADAGLDRITVSLDSLDDETFRAMNDVDFPRRARARRASTPRRGRPRPVKVNVGRQARASTRTAILPMARALPRHRPSSCASSSTWTSAHERLAARRRRPRGRDRRARSPPSCPLEPVDAALPRRGRAALALRATAAARSASSPRSRSRSAATARGPGSRPRASSTPASSPPAGHDLRALLRGGASDAELARRDRRHLGGRDDRYSELRTAETAACQGRDVATSAASRADA